MDSTDFHTGRCLCGKIEFHLPKDSNQITVCHCKMCRTWCGSPLMALNSKGPIKFKNPENISYYRSSEWAERGFCKECGTNLFCRLVSDDVYNFPVGTLDDDPEMKMALQLFIDQKPEWYNFSEETNTMTQQEVFDLYAPKN